VVHHDQGGAVEVGHPRCTPYTGYGAVQGLSVSTMRAMGCGIGGYPERRGSGTILGAWVAARRCPCSPREAK